MIQRYFEFRELTDDGLLKSVPMEWLHEDPDTTLCVSYDSRDDAEAALLAKAKRDVAIYGSMWSPSYVIVECVRVC